MTKGESRTLVGLAAVLIIAIGATLLTRTDSGAGTATPPPVTPTVDSATDGAAPAGSEELHAPGGQRWVVARGLALLVPWTWSDTDLGCEYDLRPSVVYDGDHWSECLRLLPSPTFAPSVQFLCPDSPTVVELRATATVVMPGLDATRTEMTTTDGISRMALVLADTGQVVLAESRNQAEVHAIMASARRPPSGGTAVPDTLLLGRDAAVGQLRASGFDVAVKQTSGVYAAGRVVASDPPVGAPAEPGTRVTLTVSTGLDGMAVTERQLRRRGITLADPGAAVAAYPKEKIEDRISDYGDGKAVQIYLQRATAASPGARTRDRLVWVVLNADTLQYSGGGKIRDKPVPPTYFMSDMFQFYDARTGQGLYGGTI